MKKKTPSSTKPWLQLYPDETPSELFFEEITIPQAIIRNANQYPELTAFYFYGKSISYAEFWVLLNRTAQALSDIGIKKGDYVTLLLPDIPQLPIINVAVQLLGAVCVMNNPLYEKQDLSIQIKQIKPQFIIVFDLLYPKIKHLRQERFIKQIIICQVNDLLSVPATSFPKGTYLRVPLQQKVTMFKELISRFPNKDNNLKDQSSWNDLAVIIYTGGTTGLSKAVLLNHANISQNVQQTRAYLGKHLIEGKERILAIFPFFHAAGYVLVMSFASFYALSYALVPRRDPNDILTPYLEILNQYRPTYFYSIPSAVNELVNMENLRQVELGSVKIYGMGDAHIPQWTYNTLKEHHPNAKIFKAYGQTEITALGVATPLDLPYRKGSSGIPVPNVNVKIVDLKDNKQEVPLNQMGEILIQCPQMMQGYYQNPEKTAQVIQKGWVHSGDVGYMDEEGWLYVMDRKEDLIYKNQHYFSPQIIDQHLYNHPAILEACTVGIFPKEECKKMTLVTFIVPLIDDFLPKVCMTYCHQNLKKVYIPDVIEIKKELPKSTIGKILRGELRKEAKLLLSTRKLR